MPLCSPSCRRHPILHHQAYSRHCQACTTTNHEPHGRSAHCLCSYQSHSKSQSHLYLTSFMILPLHAHESNVDYVSHAFLPLLCVSNVCLNVADADEYRIAIRIFTCYVCLRCTLLSMPAARPALPEWGRACMCLQRVYTTRVYGSS